MALESPSNIDKFIKLDINVKSRTLIFILYGFYLGYFLSGCSTPSSVRYYQEGNHAGEIIEIIEYLYDLGKYYNVISIEDKINMATKLIQNHEKHTNASRLSRLKLYITNDIAKKELYSIKLWEENVSKETLELIALRCVENPKLGKIFASIIKTQADKINNRELKSRMSCLIIKIARKMMSLNNSQTAILIAFEALSLDKLNMEAIRIIGEISGIWINPKPYGWRANKMYYSSKNKVR